MGESTRLKFIIEIDDKGNPVVKNLDGSIQKLGKTTTAATGQAVGGFGAMWKQMALGMGVMTGITSLMSTFTRSVREGVGSAIDFESKFANVTTLLKAGDPIVAELEKGLLGMAGSLGSATELTEGMYNALSAGVEPAAALDFVASSAKFAKASLAGMYESVDVLTTVINAYGLKASEVTEVSDVLFQVIKDGKVTGEELAGALGTVIPTAAAMGVNLREVGAAIAIMTQGGIKADIAVTSLNATLLSALNPTKEAMETAKSLGIELSRAGIEGAGGLQKWLADLKVKLKDNDDVIVKIFPNIRALRAAMSLAGEQAGRYAQEVETLNKVSGANQEAFEKQEKTFGAMAEAIKNKLLAVVTTALLPALTKMAEWLKANQAAIEAFIVKAVAFGKEAIGAFAGVVGWILKSKDALVAAGAAMATFWAVGKAAALLTALKSVAAGFIAINYQARMLQANGVGAISATTQAVHHSTGAVTGLSGVLGKLPAIGMAAFAGWQIGRLISEFLGLDNAVQNAFEGVLNFLDLQAKEKGQASAITTQRAQSIEQIRALGKELGVTSGSLGANVQAIYANKDALAKLEPNARAIVERMGQKAVAALKSAAALAEEKKASDQAAAATGGHGAAAAKTAEQLESERKAAEAAAKAFDAFGVSLGFITKGAAGDLDQQTAALIKTLGLYGDQLDRSGEAQVKVWETALTLRNGYMQLGKEMPPALDQIIERMQNLNTSTGSLEVSMRDLFEIAMPGFPQLGVAVDAAATQAQELGMAMLQIAKGQIPDAALAMMDFGNKTDDNAGKTKKWALNWKDANEVMEFGKSLLGQVGEVLGALGIELGATGQALMGAAEGAMSFVQGLTSGNPLAIIAGGLKLITGLIKAFSGDGVGEAISRENAWMKLTKQQIEQLRELEKQYGSTHAATSDMLDSIIQQTDVTVQNFDQWTRRVREILSDLDQGKMTLAQTQQQTGDSFNALIAKAKELGTEGSAGLMAFFDDLKNRGMEVAEVQQYINAQLDAGLQGYKDLKAAMEASADAQEAFGDVNITVFEDMLRYEELVAKNKGVVDGINAATAALNGMSNAQRLTQAEFDQFARAGGKAYDKLIAGGMDSSQALKTMGPYLQRLQYLHEQYGYTIDDATQKLLNEAKAAGIVSENQQTDGERMIGLLESIAKALGADIPGALAETGRAASGAFATATAAVGRFNDELDEIGKTRTVSIKSLPGEIPAATGADFIAPAKSFLRLVVGEDEAEHVKVTPLSKMKSGTGSAPSQGGNVMNIDVALNGVITPDNVASAMITAIRENRRGIRSVLQEA